MMAQGTSTQGPLFAGGRPGTLKLVVLLALAIMLMLADRQRGFLVVVRERALGLTAPVYWLASLPAAGIDSLELAFRDREALAAENQALRETLLRTQTELYQRRSEGEAQTRVLAWSTPRAKTPPSARWCASSILTSTRSVTACCSITAAMSVFPVATACSTRWALSARSAPSARAPRLRF